MTGVAGDPCDWLPCLGGWLRRRSGSILVALPAWLADTYGAAAWSLALSAVPTNSCDTPGRSGIAPAVGRCDALYIEPACFLCWPSIQVRCNKCSGRYSVAVPAVTSLFTADGTTPFPKSKAARSNQVKDVAGMTIGEHVSLCGLCTNRALDAAGGARSRRLPAVRLLNRSGS